MQIDIASETFRRLQRHARPFEDTPDTVVNRAVDALEHFCGESGSPDRSLPLAEEKHIDPHDLPNMAHTRVLEAHLDGARVDMPKWNAIYRQMLVLAHDRFPDFEELRAFWPGNIVAGTKNDDGYQHLPEIDVSVQGTYANAIVKALVEVASHLGIEVEIRFMWRNKPAAAFPGESRRLVVPRR